MSSSSFIESCMIGDSSAIVWSAICCSICSLNINQYPVRCKHPVQVHLVCGDVGSKLGEPGVVEAGEQRINNTLLSSGIARFNPTVVRYIQMDAYLLHLLFLIITISPNWKGSLFRYEGSHRELFGSFFYFRVPDFQDPRIFTFACALNFTNSRFGSLFWLPRVPIRSLFHNKLGPYL